MNLSKIRETELVHQVVELHPNVLLEVDKRHKVYRSVYCPLRQGGAPGVVASVCSRFVLSYIRRRCIGPIAQRTSGLCEYGASFGLA